MKKYIVLLTLIPMLCGCENFLNVNPKSEVIDKEMFSTASYCEDAIYGIYAEMGLSNDLYGSMLSFRVPELLIGNFEVKPSDDLTLLVQRQWEQDKAITFAEDIWKNAYKTIGYINNAAGYILAMPDNKFPDVKIYKGELLALRAFMHFEMARLFAVPFASTNETAKGRAIPYVTKYGIEVTPFSSLDEAYAKIIADLEKAEDFLSADQTHVTDVRDNAAAGFTSCRILHLNLYAVQAMMARVYWTMGKLDLAETYAQKVIDSKKFPLMKSSESWNESDNGTVNMKETLFGLNSPTFTSTYYTIHFLTGSSKAVTLNSKYLDVYNNDGNDQRFSKWFDTQSTQCVKNLNKMYTSGIPGATYNGKSIIGMSMIRIPELYYIVAEANLNKNSQKAMQMLDEVVSSRGLTKYADRQGVERITFDDIYNERIKEFYAEGQDFHNMKRLRKDITIKSLGTLSGTDDATYTMPIPKSIEDNYRK